MGRLRSLLFGAVGITCLWAQDAYEEAVHVARRGDTLKALRLLEAAQKVPATALRATVYKGRLLLGQKNYAALRAVGWQLLQGTSLLERKWGIYFLGSVYAAEGYEDSLSFLWRQYVLPSPKSTLHDLPKVTGSEGKIILSDTALLPVPVPFFPKNLGPQVNSKYSEYGPTLTADGRTLYLTRMGPKRAKPDELTEDTYWCERDAKEHPLEGCSAPWKPPSILNTTKASVKFPPMAKW
ncbi:MAG: hypothetical protein NZ958_01640 [Bacteroidia bacterium]|nr:hypothetical protein [Bacteroidia bacterium]MDW8089045.1 hypothetical protein [Bacteroidia bacterium]